MTDTPTNAAVSEAMFEAAAGALECDISDLHKEERDALSDIYLAMRAASPPPDQAGGSLKGPVFVAIERPEDYEDVHPDLVLDDFCCSRGKGFSARIVPDPSPPPGQDQVEAVMDVTPTGAFGLPRWQYRLRAASAVLETFDQPLSREFRQSLSDQLGELQSAITAMKSLGSPGDGEVVEVLKPFAAAYNDCLDEDDPATAHIWESAAAMNITVGELRKAADLLSRLRDGK